MNKLESISKKKRTKYIIFTICFWGYVIPKLVHIFSLNLTMFGGWDAITQIYPTMVLTRRILLDMLQNGSAFPMINWNVGMGADTLVTYNWHGLGDPLYLITVFFAEKQLPYVYGCLFFFKVYLGGLAFILLISSYKEKYSNFAYVIGAFVYCFTGFTVQCNMHLIFTHCMYMIPLMLLGAERVLQRKKKWLLCVSTFLFALNGFFFLYIGSIALAVYVLYRLFRNKSSMQNGILTIGSLLAEYLLGLGLAGIVFIPNIVGFLHSNRAISQMDISLFMSKEGIIDSFRNVFFPQVSNYQVLSLCAISVVSLLFILLAKKKIREKWNIIFLMLLTWIPMVSCVMSGFGEVYDRWEIVILLYFAFLTTMMWDELVSLSYVQKGGALLIYLGLGYYAKKNDILEHERFGVTVIAYGVILVITIVGLPLFRYLKKEKIGYVFSFILIIMLICNSWSRAWRDREISYVTDNYELQELLTGVEDDFYRIDNQKATYEPRNAQNVALLLDYPGIAEYFSIQNPYYTGALAGWDVTTEAFGSHMNLGLDERTLLESLCSVKYMISRNEDEMNIPYGFVKIKQTVDGTWNLYENQYVLPLVYSYDRIYNGKDYTDKSGFEKQQIMIQAAVVDETYEGSIQPIEEIVNSLHELEYQVIQVENGTIENNVVLGENGVTLTIAVKLKAACENYIFMDDIRQSGGYTFQVEDEVAKMASVEANQDDGKIGVNLGMPSEDKVIQVKISIPGKVSYSLDGLQTLYYVFDHYENQIEARKEKSLSDLEVSGNKISYNVYLEEDKLLCLAVPYSEGWNVKMDGEKVITHPVNDMFLGVDVSQGEHTVEYVYTTPGIYIGMIMMILSLIIIILWVGIEIKNRKKA